MQGLFIELGCQAVTPAYMQGLFIELGCQVVTPAYAGVVFRTWLCMVVTPAYASHTPSVLAEDLKIPLVGLRNGQLGPQGHHPFTLLTGGEEEQVKKLK